MSQSRLNAEQQLDNPHEIVAISNAFHASLDLDTVAQTIVDRLFRVASIYAVALYRYLPQTDRVVGVAYAPESGADLSTHLLVTQYDMLHDMVCSSPSVAMTTYDQADQERPVWLVPLQAQQELVGVLALWEREPGALTERERYFVATISEQAALAWRNALTHAQTNDDLHERVIELSTIEVVSRHIAATLDRDVIASDVLAAAVSAINAEIGTCLLLNAAGDFEVIVRFDTSETRRVGIGEINPASSLIAQVVQTRKPVLVADSRLDGALIGLMPDSGSALGVPILSDDEPVGILLFEDSKPLTFTESHVRFVKTLAEHAAVAIENARLYQAVRAGRDQLQAILDSTRDAVFLFDHRGRLLRFNPVAESMLGQALAPYLGQSFLSWLRSVRARQLQSLTGFSLLQFRQYVLDVLRNPARVTQRQFQQQHGEDVRYIDETGSPVLDHEGQPVGWLLVWRDNTEERKLDTMRRELSSMVVHDLRNPITSIISGMDMLHDLFTQDTLERDVMTKVLQIAQNSAENMLNLVQSLLDVSRLEQSNVTLDCESLSLLDSIDYAIKSMLGLAIASEIGITTNAPPDLPTVWIDDEKIQRVLVNLLDNALRHTPPKGTIVIDAWHQPDQKHVTVRVEDTGPGIPPDERQRIFDKFVQLDYQGALRGHKGTGLGLTFCKLAIEAHGGTIWVEEGALGGASFCFTVPVVPAHGSWLESDLPE
ncbi:MAG: GAF domain-containing protein [Anaerolineae bacterium]|nr:GAF domain-containing protein [Anaerolineae bacterium]